MVNLKERFSANERKILSFEVFPPKTEKGMENLCGETGVLNRLYQMGPDYISCTYGADGSNIGRNLDVLKRIVSDQKTIPVTHFTCIGATKESVDERIEAFLEAGIDHILALRGDLPIGWKDTHGEFAHASDLVAYLKKKWGDRLTVAVSGLPEGHIESVDSYDDIRYLKLKQDSGADYIMTQLTWDMEAFSRWMEDIRSAGITMPVDAGVMPVLEPSALIKMSFSRNGCAIPRDLAKLISNHWIFPHPFDKDPEDREVAVKLRDFREAGLEYSVNQIRKYVETGVNGIHLYAMNKSEAVERLVRETGL